MALLEMYWEAVQEKDSLEEQKTCSFTMALYWCSEGRKFPSRQDDWPELPKNFKKRLH